MTGRKLDGGVLDIDLSALDLGVKMNELRNPETPTPLVSEQNGHVYIFQGSKSPLIFTPKQFEKIALQLGYIKE